VRTFFVRTGSPGVTSGAWHTYVGIKGFSHGRLEFRDVRVSGGPMLVERDAGHIRAECYGSGHSSFPSW
jgi:alkylation response protein AidB-like acyl-CoA dehydrogenase